MNVLPAHTPFSSLALRSASSAPQQAPGASLTGPSPATSAPVEQAEIRSAALGYRAGGAIGAAVGTRAGRVALVLGSAYLAGEVAGRLGLGPIGMGVAAAAGLAGGVVLESKTHLGRDLGGLSLAGLGGGVGWLAGGLGWTPGEGLQKTTRNFALSELPKRLHSRFHTSNERLSHNPEAVAAAKAAQPGDIVLFQDERLMGGGATLQKLAGASGDYTHVGVVSDTGTVLDVLETDIKEMPLERWLGHATNMAILRPRYADMTSAWNLVDGMRRDRPGITWDPGFDLSTDKQQYCGEFVFKSLKKYAPEIEVGTRKVWGIAYPIVTADEFRNSPSVETLYDSGSNFWLNDLSRFA